MLLTHFLHLVRITLLAIVAAGSIRCAPARAFVPPSADAATSSALFEASTTSPIGEVVERDSVKPVVDRPRVSIDVVRARVNSKRQVVAVDTAKAAAARSWR